MNKNHVWLKETPEETIARLQKELADERAALAWYVHDIDGAVLVRARKDLCDEIAAHRQTQAALEAERAAHEETKRKLELVRNDRNREIDTTRAVNECLRAERAAHEETRQLLKERLRAMGGNGRLYIEEKAAHEETKRKLELALGWIRATGGV